MLPSAPEVIPSQDDASPSASGRVDCSSASSFLARATRDLTVPIEHSQTAAVSAYDSPMTWVSTIASRRSACNPASSSSISVAISGCELGAGAGTPSASSTHRRLRWATRSAQRRAITNSQVLAEASPRKRGRARHAARNVSWVASAASWGPTRWAQNRQIGEYVALTNSARARSSPSLARIRRLLSLSTALTVPSQAQARWVGPPPPGELSPPWKALPTQRGEGRVCRGQAGADAKHERRHSLRCQG